MDFTEDPFRDYRYEDPFNLQDPFCDAPDSDTKKSNQDADAAFLNPPSKLSNKNSSFSAFETDDFFATSKTFEKNNNDAFNGRQSVPLPSNDPFSKSGRVSAPIVNQSWAAWGGNRTDSNDNWATTDGWADAPKNATQPPTWTTGKTKSTSKEKKKEKSPKPAGKSFTLGNLGRSKNKNKSPQAAPSAPSLFPSEEQQLAWAAAEGRRLEEERRRRRHDEDQELQMAVALSIKNQ